MDLPSSTDPLKHFIVALSNKFKSAKVALQLFIVALLLDPLFSEQSSQFWSGTAHESGQTTV